MLKSRKVGDVGPLIHAVSTKGVNAYTQQAFGRQDPRRDHPDVPVRLRE